ncbi:ISNCY family transposase [Desulfogranum marinum]|uniref:ISNCY family transposase n=1 Tax=Desulfogranum marinum TaxID=453220 RepID=UPI0019668205|nr:ISNCY family transposase [Desulfogranum marinum]MBM9514706.1 ISNCY family transposase [Desulfogranum marinum]
MRKTHNQQLPLAEAAPDHPKAKELEKISDILDENTIIYDLVLQDIGSLTQKSDAKSGACGMTAEQVIRAASVKQIEGCSYRELEFRLVDSRAYGLFCRIPFGKHFKKSTLQKKIKAISEVTWEEINRVLIGYAQDAGIEKGRKVRVDCTVVETNIHAPYDSELLFDSVRVLARLLDDAKTRLPGIMFSFHNHRRAAKRRNLEITNAKNNAARQKPYRKLIELTEKTIGYAEKGVHSLQNYVGSSIIEQALASGICKQLQEYLPIVRQVACQTKRRIFAGESVPALEKIVSIFEPHTDIIRKDRRDTYYGHKICLTGGASNLILDCVVLDGNPADTTLTGSMLDRQNDIYGRYPLQASFDGGFTSQTNLKEAKDNGVKDVCFSKGRGLKEEDMCRSRYVYKGLRNFRAGIESGISWLKRSLGLARCTWKGYEGFKSYVWASIVSANLLTIARQQLA